MQRRHFIHAAGASVLFPVAAGRSVAALASFWQRQDYVFFDERFPRARRIATAWSASYRPIAVHGDITPFWSGGLDRMTRVYPLRLRGVTTESFLFCLRILVPERANLDVQVSRVDRNLLQWTMCTTPRSITERCHG